MKILSKAIAMGILSAVVVSGCSSTPPANDGMSKNTEVKKVDTSKMVRSGSLTFDAKAYNLIVGGTWGQGVLTYKGKQYKFRGKSVGAGYALGTKDVWGSGTVYNLNNVADFAGTYYGVKAGGTAGVGASALGLQNSKGVYVNINSQSQGVAVDASAGVARVVVEFY